MCPTSRACVRVGAGGGCIHSWVCARPPPPRVPQVAGVLQRRGALLAEAAEDMRTAREYVERARRAAE